MKRTGSIERQTAETEIRLSVNLDGEGKSKIDTGVGFFDHMLTLLARHGALDLEVKAKGDLHIDQHHTVEDVGIALGEPLLQAASPMRQLVRYGPETLRNLAVQVPRSEHAAALLQDTRELIGPL